MVHSILRRFAFACLACCLQEDLILLDYDDRALFDPAQVKVSCESAALLLQALWTCSHTELANHPGPADNLGRLCR